MKSATDSPPARKLITAEEVAARFEKTAEIFARAKFLASDKPTKIKNRVQAIPIYRNPNDLSEKTWVEMPLVRAF